MTTQRHLILGIFFVGAVALLGYFTVFMADVSFFGQKTRLSAFFSETNGLREGDAVLVAGMRWGKVDGLTFRPTAEFSERIEVSFSLTEAVTLKEDVRVTIEDATLLGGKILAIEPGSAGSPPRVADVKLMGRVAGNVLEEVQAIVVDNQESIKSAIEGLVAIVRELEDTGGTIGRLINDDVLGEEVARSITSFSKTFENLDQITGQIAAGQGSVGRLLMQEEVYEQIASATRKLDALLADARDALASAQDPSRGTIGMLWSDPSLARDLASTARNLEALTQGLVDGEGTLGALLSDDRLSENLTTLSQRLVDGDGTLGRLLKEDQLYEDFAETISNLRLASAQLTTADGTIGLLLNDDELYLDIQKAIGTLTGTLEEAREAAPISTFLSTVFLGF